MKNKKLSTFSVPLGLVDYINPLFYTITSFVLVKNFYNYMDLTWYTLLVIGAIISLIFGFTIPTVKLLVGLGKFEFKMPVNLVFYVNTGIFITGNAIFYTIFNIRFITLIILVALSLMLLYLIYNKTKKFNTVAVLIGAIGYILIYSSLIYLAIKTQVVVSIVLYIIATLFFVSLCLIGIKANLKDARIHWIIETSNILCQMFVALGTLLLFK